MTTPMTAPDAVRRWVERVDQVHVDGGLTSVFAMQFDEGGMTIMEMAGDRGVDPSAALAAYELLRAYRQSELRPH
jgi:hypothetical protein